MNHPNHSLTPTDYFPAELPPEAVEQLREAKTILEHHGLADRLTELMGMPITASLKMLPAGAEEILQKAIDKSLHLALDAAVRSLGKDAQGRTTPQRGRHRLVAGLTGAAGGAFGLTAVAAELPVSTLVILRSVADIARSQGEDLSQIEARLACLEVFAIDSGRHLDGGPDAVDDDTEIGYFAVRASLGKQVADASRYVLQHQPIDHAAPPLVRLINEVAKRFGVVVSKKLTAQAIPVIGAVGGALINSYFIDHYQELARAHFTIRRLEREFGHEPVRRLYQRLHEPVD